MSDFLTLDNTVLTVVETDVSTAGSVWVVSPADGKIVYFASVIDGAIGAANAAIRWCIYWHCVCCLHNRH